MGRHGLQVCTLLPTAEAWPHVLLIESTLTVSTARLALCCRSIEVGLQADLLSKGPRVHNEKHKQWPRGHPEKMMLALSKLAVLISLPLVQGRERGKGEG